MCVGGVDIQKANLALNTQDSFLLSRERATNPV